MGCSSLFKSNDWPIFTLQDHLLKNQDSSIVTIEDFQLLYLGFSKTGESKCSSFVYYSWEILYQNKENTKMY